MTVTRDLENGADPLQDALLSLDKYPGTVTVTVTVAVASVRSVGPALGC